MFGFWRKLGVVLDIFTESSYTSLSDLNAGLVKMLTISVLLRLVMGPQTPIENGFSSPSVGPRELKTDIRTDRQT